MLTLLVTLVAIWFVALLITVWDPPWLSVESYVFLEGLAVTMPFIIVFGSIAIGGIAGMIGLII